MRLLRVFLCYATVDKEAVRRLYDRLRADGFAPWFDEVDVLAGQHRSSEVARAVRESDVVLVCLSKASVAGPGTLHRHIKQALDVAEEQPEGTIFVIPVRLEPCDVPDRLTHLQGVDLFDEENYGRLEKALRFRESTLLDDAGTPGSSMTEELASSRPATGGEPAPIETKGAEPGSVARIAIQVISHLQVLSA